MVTVVVKRSVDKESSRQISVPLAGHKPPYVAHHPSPKYTRAPTTTPILLALKLLCAIFLQSTPWPRSKLHPASTAKYISGPLAAYTPAPRNQVSHPATFKNKKEEKKRKNTHPSFNKVHHRHYHHHHHYYHNHHHHYHHHHQSQQSTPAVSVENPLASFSSKEHSVPLSKGHPRLRAMYYPPTPQPQPHPSKQIHPRPTLFRKAGKGH